MDSQLDVEHEVFDPITNQQYITDSREEALDYFEQGWLVVERHISVYKPSVHSSTRVDVQMMWNNNPDFQEKIR